MRLAIRAFLIAFFGVMKRWKIVIFLFLFNLLFSVFLAAPIIRSLVDDVSRFHGLPAFLDRFNPELYSDFINNHQAVLKNFVLGAGVGGILYYLVFNVLSGGMIAILADPKEKTTMKTFLGASGRFAFRFTRLLFYYCILLTCVALVNHGLDRCLIWFAENLMEGGAAAGTLGWLFFTKNLIMLLLLVFAIVSFNYAKTEAVVRERHFMGGCMLSGVGFTLAHPVVTGFFIILSTALLAAVAAGYFVLSRWIDPSASYRFLDSIGGITVSGAVLYVILAQFIQMLVQAAILFRHTGQVYIFKYLTVQAGNPDPELANPDPFSPFITDRPYAGPPRNKTNSDLEGKINV